MIEKIFDPFWNIFYSFRMNQEKFEYSCFPFPFKINCVTCSGCIHNKNPFLAPPKHKGPYKVYTTELFNEQYSKLFDESALVELLWDLEKHNQKIDENMEV